MFLDDYFAPPLFPPPPPEQDVLSCVSLSSELLMDISSGLELLHLSVAIALSPSGANLTWKDKSEDKESSMSSPNGRIEND